MRNRLATCLLMLACAWARAATTNFLASNERATVQAAIDAASAGDTVFLTNTPARWTLPVTISSGTPVNLRGYGMRQTYITNASSSGSIDIVIADGDYWEMSGVSFIIETAASTGVLELQGGSSSATKFRITDCEVRFKSNAGRGFNVVDTYGVIDNCFFHKGPASTATPQSITLWRPGSAGIGAATNRNNKWFQDHPLGTDLVTCVEDCGFDYENSYGNDGALDAYDETKIVFRYNRLTNTWVGWHGADSGDYPRAPRNFEVYGNQFFVVDYYGGGSPSKAMSARGSPGVWWSNVVNPGFGSAINVNINAADPSYTRSGWSRVTGSNPADGNFTNNSIGYPILDQLGRGAFPTNSIWYKATQTTYTNDNGQYQAYDPVYLWGNTWNGSSWNVVTPYNAATANFVVSNRDWIVGVKPGYAPLQYPHPLREPSGLPTISSSTNLVGTNYLAFSYQITTSPGNCTSFGATNLPANLALTAASGLISGIPSNVDNVTITNYTHLAATNAVGGTNTPANIVIWKLEDTEVTAAYVGATVGVPFTHQIAATYWATNYGATNYGAAIPETLSTDLETGLISCTFTSAAVYYISMLATNAVSSDWALLKVFVSAAPPPEVTWYVECGAATAGDSETNGSEAFPFQTVAYALPFLTGGDMLVVKPGTNYIGFGSFTIPNTASGTPSAPTVIRGSEGKIIYTGSGNSGRLKMDGVSNLVFSGFLISNFNQGLFIEGGSHDIVVSNCTIARTGQELLHVKEASYNVLIVSNLIQFSGQIGSFNAEGVYIGTGGGGDYTHDVIIRGNVIHTTESEGIELKEETYACTIEYNSISNTCLVEDYRAIEIMNDTSGVDPRHIVRYNIIQGKSPIKIGRGSTVYDNLIYGVEAGDYALLVLNSDDDTHGRYFFNNTVNIATNLFLNGDSYHNGTLLLLNNIGPTTSVYNLSYDADYFTDAANNDYTLVLGSAPINAGTNLSSYLTNDFRGLSRPQGVAYDIGAYEYDEEEPGSPSSLKARLQGRIITRGKVVFH